MCLFFAAVEVDVFTFFGFVAFAEVASVAVSGETRVAVTMTSIPLFRSSGVIDPIPRPVAYFSRSCCIPDASILALNEVQDLRQLVAGFVVSIPFFFENVLETQTVS